MLGTASTPAKKALPGTPVTDWCNLRKMKTKEISPSARSYRQLEDVVGCKWSVSVLQAVGAGISRPGALERHVRGISTKVLSERLRKLASYGLLDKQVYAEVPPRTEYSLTENGQKLVGIIGQIRLLDDEIRSAEPSAPTDADKRRR
jgi:DNA-binding HxlR family transcriptional regulator